MQLFLIWGLVAGCNKDGDSLPSGSTDDTSSDDTAGETGETGETGDTPPIPPVTTWVDCAWSSVPLTRLNAAWIGDAGTWASSIGTVYEVDLEAQVLARQEKAPTEVRNFWGDPDGTLWALSKSTVSVRSADLKTWSEVHKDKRALTGIWGNHSGVWVGTTDGVALHVDTDDKWTEEAVGGVSPITSLWGRNDEIWAIGGTHVYVRDGAGDWTSDMTYKAKLSAVTGDDDDVWATIADAPAVWHRDAGGDWSVEAPSGAKGELQMWTLDGSWFATDRTHSWSFDSKGVWSAISGPEALVDVTSIVSDGSTALALGGGDTIATAEGSGAWTLATGSPADSVYDSTILGTELIVGGNAGFVSGSAGIARKVTDFFWQPELVGESVRALDNDGVTVWAAGIGGVWSRNATGTWSEALSDDTETFTALHIWPDKTVVVGAIDGSIHLQAKDKSWTTEKSGLTNVSAIVGEYDQIWVGGDGIFFRDAKAGWEDQSPGNLIVHSMADIDGVLWAVGEENGLPTTYTRSTKEGSTWTLEVEGPTPPDGAIAYTSIDSDPAGGIWLSGFTNGKKGAEPFIVRTGVKAGTWSGELTGGSGSFASVAWADDRRWAFGPTSVYVRILSEPECL